MQVNFSIGDKIVHAQHGAGRVIGINDEEMVEGFNHYYEIEMFGKELTLFVPVRKAEEIGVRPVMTQAKLSRVLDILRDQPRGLPQNFRKRQDQISEKLNTGIVGEIAEVVRDLTWYREHAKLTRKDTDLLKRGLNFLASEMALVSDTELSAANEVIDAILVAAITAAANQNKPPQELGSNT